jgi:hypothetical protein
MWLEAANPGLFTTVRGLDAATEKYREAAASLAGRIGSELVPRVELTVAERRSVLGIRRRLHNCALLAEDDWRWLNRLCSRIPGTGLGAELARTKQIAAGVVSLEHRAVTAIEAEETRLLAAPWELLNSSPAGRRVLGDPSLGAAADIAERLARSEPWTRKRMRRRSEYLWRVIGRAAAKTTPRGWLGHVAVAADGDGGGLALTAEVAWEWTGNVHASRAAALAAITARAPAGARAATPDVDTRISLASLHCPEPPDHLRIWESESGSGYLRTVRLRRSRALDVIIGALRDGPSRPDELAERAAGVAQSRPAARLFVSRLTDMGVLQASAPPARIRWASAPSRPAGDVAAAPSQGTGFLDVYRGSIGAPEAPAGLHHAIEQVQRLRALMRLDAPRDDSPLRDLLAARPRPVLDVLTYLLSANPAAKPHEHGFWPRARRSGSGYSRLLDMISAQIDAIRGGSDQAADITPAILDAAGAPPGRLTWPVDVTMRQLGPGLCVLDGTAPAGLLDARFIEALEQMHGPVPHAVAYRDFLAGLERRSGVHTVELLIPPPAERAANAVRRPLYAGAWTGDSNPDIYGSWGASAADAAEFLPLAALTVRRNGERVLVAVGDRPVRVLLHATRNPLGPWRLLAGLLQDPAQRAEQTCPLRCSLTAFKHRNWLPRIIVAGSVVVSAAQWRIDPSDLWDPDAPRLAKVRALVRLRDRRGLPRWVFASGHPGARPLACDLESLRALRILEEAAAVCRKHSATVGSERGAGYGLIAAEMLPAPPGLGVPDLGGEPGDRVAAELMIRLPAAADMASLAARITDGEGLVTATSVKGGETDDGTRGRRGGPADQRARG